MKSICKDDTLTDSKQRDIPISSWIPAKPICQLVIVHGFSEHMRYYRTVGRKLSEKGIAIHLMDLPGHGMAGGIRGHIDSFEEYLDNLHLLLTGNPHFLKTKPVFLLGHSLGGLISTQYCLRREHPFSGLLLTSPLTGFSPLSSLPVLALMRYLAKNHGAEPFPKPSGVASLSRNPEQWRVYRSDPCRGRMISPALYLNMVAMVKTTQLYAPFIKLPLLMFISEKDRVVSPLAAQRFFAQAGSTDKSLVVFAEAMHELFQEVECEQMLETITSWVKDRV